MPPLLPPVSPKPFPYLPKSILIIFLSAYAGSKPPQTLISLCHALLGWSVPPDAYMTWHERLDFVIVALLFGVLVGAENALSVLSAEWFVSTVFRLPVYPHNSTFPRSPATHGLFGHDRWTIRCILATFGRHRGNRHCTIIRPNLHS